MIENILVVLVAAAAARSVKRLSASKRYSSLCTHPHLRMSFSY